MSTIILMFSCPEAGEHCPVYILAAVALRLWYR